MELKELARRSIDVEAKIKDALRDSKPLNWSELQKKSDISKGALSKHLNTLITNRIVLTKTEENRPPRTLYYLADNKTLKTISYLRQNMSEEQVIFFVENFLDTEILTVIEECVGNIIEYKNNLLRKQFKDGIINVARMFNSIGISKAPWGKNGKPQTFGINFEKFRIELPEPDNKKKISVFLLKETYSETAIQLVLFLYSIEKDYFDSLPISDETRKKLQYRGNLEDFFVLPLIQKYYLWDKFEAMYVWWQNNVSQKISSICLILLLALDIFINLPFWIKGTG